MTTTIFGNALTFVIDDAVNCQAVFPSNGEPVNTVPPASTVKTILDYVASVALDLARARTLGVNRISTVSSIAGIRSTTGQTERDLILMFNPSYSGGSDGLLYGFGLYVFAGASTAPETAIPNVPNAYVVVAPTVGPGRWLNVAASLGYTLGSLPTFVPRPIDRMKLFGSSGAGSGFGSTSGVSGTNVPITAPNAIELSLAMSINDRVSLDVSFDTRSTTSFTQNYVAYMEYREGGSGTWFPVSGASALIDSANSTTFHVHLGGIVQAPSNNAYYFRVAIQAATGQTIRTSESWTFRGQTFSAI